MGYEAKILADSIAPCGVRLTTVLWTFPRFILAEVNTHRMLSRSSASSRAVPIAKRIAAAKADPFVPEVFGKNRAGMSASEELEGSEAEHARDVWLMALGAAMYYAAELAELGVHKQYANRLLEPFLWHTAIVTATEWSNMRALRISANAQPEFCAAAEVLFAAIDTSTPKKKRDGEWHLPFVEGSPDEAEVIGEVGSRWLGSDAEMELAAISSARCARVSYILHDGMRSVAKDIALASQLRSNGHMAPFEHAARVEALHAGFNVPFIGNFRWPWKQYRKFLRHEDDYGKFIAEADLK